MASSEGAQVKPSSSNSEPVKKPVCMIVLGMAGSGKTTFVQKLNEHLNTATNAPPYTINLDPACKEVPYPANIDIRDTVNYKEVMKHYKLGPNGGIVTALNLFCTKFGNPVELIEKAGEKFDYCVIDTPGQIEVFTWSVSGTIITEALAAKFPTIVVYVMDIVRSESPTTFMSNMLYACSILYKARLPFIVVMNKIDVTDHSFAIEWMQDFEVFDSALDADPSHASNLSRSLFLTLDAFYRDLKCCGVSAKTGVGFSRFLELVGEGVQEYQEDYLKEYQKVRKEKESQEKQKNEESLRKLKKSGEGVEVKLSNLNDEEASDPAVNMKLPGDISSEDEEGTEEQVVNVGDEEMEEQNFQSFVNTHKKCPHQH